MWHLENGSISNGLFGHRLPQYFRYKFENSIRDDRVRALKMVNQHVDLNKAVESILLVQKIPAHPYLDSLHFVWLENGHPREIYMSSVNMNLGQYLESEESKNGYLESAVETIIGEVACAVDYLHTYQIIHNSVKQETILIESGAFGSVKTKLTGFEKCCLIKVDEDILIDYKALSSLSELLHNELYKRDAKEDYLESRDYLMETLMIPPLSDVIGSVFSKSAKMFTKMDIDVVDMIVPREFHTSSRHFKGRDFTIKFWESCNFHHTRRTQLDKEELNHLKLISRHAHIVTIFDYIHVEAAPSGYVMEQSTSLLAGLKELRVSGLETRIFHILAEHIALGLQFLGKLGIVHGAIRPEHVVFSSSKCFQICSMDSVFRETRDTWLSYLAPELFNSREKGKDPRSDIYSFGALLVTVFQGRHPYSSYKGTITDLVEKIENGTMDPGDASESLEIVTGCCAQLRDRWSIDRVLDSISEIGDVSIKLSNEETAKKNFAEPPWVLPMDYKRGDSIEKIYTRTSKTNSRGSLTMFPIGQASKPSYVGMRIREKEFIVIGFNRLAEFSTEPFKIYLKYAIEDYRKQKLKAKPRARLRNREERLSEDEEFWYHVLRLHINASLHLERCQKFILIARYDGNVWLFVDGYLKECYDSLSHMNEIHVEKGDDVENIRIAHGTIDGGLLLGQMKLWRDLCADLFKHYLPGVNELRKAILDKRYGAYTFFFREERKIYWTSRKIEEDEVLGVLLTTLSRPLLDKCGHPRRTVGSHVGRYRKILPPNDHIVTFMFSTYPNVEKDDPSSAPEYRKFHLRLHRHRTELLIIFKHGHLIVIQDKEVKQVRMFEKKPMFMSVNTAYHKEVMLDVHLFSRVAYEDGSFVMDCWPREKLEEDQEGTLIRPKRIQHAIRDLPFIDIRDVFEIKSIGHGKFSEVYSGNCHLGKAAFKILNPNHAEAQTIDEIKVLSKLKSPHFVQLLAVVKSNEKVVGMVLEAMMTCLETVIGDSTIEYDDSRMCQWIHQIAEGLDYLQERRQVHRDVKPSNILMKDSTYVCIKLGDFGSLVEQNETTTRIGITRKYCDPAILEADSRISYHSSFDIYSLGVTIWDMFHRNTIYENYPSTMATKQTRQVDWSDLINRCTMAASLRPTAADISLEACLLFSMIDKNEIA